MRTVVGNSNRSKGTNGTPSKAYTNSVPDQHSIYPGGQHTLAFYTKCVMPEGLVTAVAGVGDLNGSWWSSLAVC